MKRWISLTLIFVMSLASLFLCSKAEIASAVQSNNLLTNPGAETGSVSGWTITASGGSGWNMSSDWDGMVRTGTHAFRSSNNWGIMEQKIDLVTAGYTAEYLDSSPTIVCSDWYTSRLNGKYFVSFQLLAQDGSTVITSNSGSAGTTQANPGNVSGNAEWAEKSYTFTGYSSGVRYALIRHGGYETTGWAGYYGPHFDDASITIAEPPVYHTVTYTAGSGGGITGDASQSIADGGDAAAVTATPAANYNFVKWSDDSTANPRQDLNIITDLSISAIFALETTAPSYGNLPGSDKTINIDNNQTIISNPYLIKVKPSDDNGISKVEFYIDDQLICTATSSDADGVYVCSWDTSKYHSTVKVYAYDNAGNRSSLLQRETTVDPSIYLAVLPQTGKY